MLYLNAVKTSAKGKEKEILKKNSSRVRLAWQKPVFNFVKSPRDSLPRPALQARPIFGFVYRFCYNGQPSSQPRESLALFIVRGSALLGSFCFSLSQRWIRGRGCVCAWVCLCVCVCVCALMSLVCLSVCQSA